MAWVFLLVAGCVAIVAARRLFFGYAAPAQPLAALRLGEYAVVQAAANAVYPPGGALEASGEQARVGAYADRYLQALPARTSTLMRLLFFAVEHGTLVFAAPGPGGRRRFSSLATEQQVALLESWRTSRFFPLRLIFTSLRAILTMGYFASPEVLRPLRLAPYAIETPVREADLLFPGIGQSRASIRHTAADVAASRETSATPLDPDGPLHPRFRERT